MELQSFMRGVIVGAVLGILFAPDSGRATRRKIAQKTADLKDSMQETCNEVVEQVSQQVNKVRDKAKDIIGQGKSAINDLKETASSSM